MSKSTPDDPADPGLAAERTDLAWSRTALAAGVAGIVLLRRVWEDIDRGDARVFVFSVIAVGAVVWLVALRWADVTARTALEGRRVADARALRRVTVATTVFCVAALVLTVLPARG